MDEDDYSEDICQQHQTCIVQAPGSRPKQQQLQQQAQDSGHRYWCIPRTAAVTRNGKYAPQDRTQQRQTDRQQVAQYSGMLRPTPVGQGCQCSQLEDETYRKVDRILNS